MLDIAIIGCGPAGMSAAVTAKNRNKEVKIFGTSIDDSNLYKAEKINNYLGINNVTGEELLKSFEKHVRDMNIDIDNKKVIEIFKMGDNFSLNVSNEFIQAKKVIISTGIPKARGFEGENEYLGKGVSYCATCDGMLYRGKEVLIYLENPKEEDDISFLSEICKKVYVITKYNEINKKEILDKENVEYLGNKKVKRIEGSSKIEKVIFDDLELEINGFFILRETILLSNIIKGLELDNSKIKVNDKYETNIKGLYAVGDVIGKPYQISKATGEGLVAALNIVEELDK